MFIVLISQMLFLKVEKQHLWYFSTKKMQVLTWEWQMLAMLLKAKDAKLTPTRAPVASEDRWSSIIDVYKLCIHNYDYIHKRNDLSGANVIKWTEAYLYCSIILHCTCVIILLIEHFIRGYMFFLVKLVYMCVRVNNCYILEMGFVALKMRLRWVNITFSLK